MSDFDQGTQHGDAARDTGGQPSTQAPNSQ